MIPRGVKVTNVKFTPMTDPKSKQVALYARVSTKDKGQDVENQLAQLREFCERQGYVIFDEYVDDESGTKGKRERDGFNRLFEDAGKRKFDVVLVWSLDRFTREGISKTIFYLQQLDGLGVNFKSYTEQYLDTDNELIRHVVLGMLAYFAKLQREKISENTKSALARKKAQGVQLGQPSKFERYQADLLRMMGEGIAKKEMARRTGLSVPTVRKYLKMIVGK